MNKHKLAGDFGAIILVNLFSSTLCDIDLKAILTQAAQRLAADAGTSLNRLALAEGLCFSASDESPGEIKCQDQSNGGCFPHEPCCWLIAMFTCIAM